MKTTFMFALSIFLLFSQPQADPADFFLPPQLDKFASKEIEDDIRAEEIGRIWDAYEMKREAFTEQREADREAFFSGLWDVSRTQNELHEIHNRILRRQYEQQDKALEARTQLVDLITDKEWDAYLLWLDKQAEDQEEREQRLYTSLEEELETFMEDFVPLLPVRKQSSVRVDVRNFRDALLAHFREYRNFDLFNHPILRKQYAGKKLENIIPLANAQSNGVYIDLLDLREKLKSELSSEELMLALEPWEDLAQSLEKITSEAY